MFIIFKRKGNYFSDCSYQFNWESLLKTSNHINIASHVCSLYMYSHGRLILSDLQLTARI
jgi:hypothetical protein